MRTQAWIVSVVIATLFVACSPQRRQQAEMTVARADSLRAAGQYYNDSAALAEAVKAWRPVRLFHPNTYAHACYHYGRWLLDRNMPVEAVEYLCDAEQMAWQDYSLKGKIFSNYINICHSANQYKDAYLFNTLSSAYFLKAKDTISYQYNEIRKTLYLGYNGQFEEADVRLEQIKNNCVNDGVLAYLYEIKSILCLQNQQYSEAINYIDSVSIYSNSSPLDWSNKATAFHFLGQMDSALYYARKVVASETGMLNILYSAYYILNNDEPDIDSDTLSNRTAYRADIGVKIKEQAVTIAHAYDHLTYLREQTRLRKIRYISILGSIVILLSVMFFLLYYRRIKLERQQRRRMEEKCYSLAAMKNLNREIHWDDYDELCNYMNIHFNNLAARLQAIPDFQEKDIRLSLLVFLGLPSKRIADVMLYSPKSIGRLKEITALKLGLHGSGLYKALWSLILVK